MGFLLAGGNSSRMGADKAFLEFRGQILLERALAVLGRACPGVAIVGDASRFSRYGSVVEDATPVAVRWPEFMPLSQVLLRS